MADAPDLATLRAAIDVLDDHLLGLLAQRLDLARTLGALKAKPGRDPHREAEIVARLTAQGLVSPELISLIWQAFFAASDHVQRENRQTF
jgi:chorismate mutase